MVTRKKRCNVFFIKDSKLLQIFFKLDGIAKELGRLPTYEEIVQYLTVMETRKYLLVTIYLQNINLIFIDKATQEEYANLDMIERLLQSFEKKDKRYHLIAEYYIFLKNKSLKKITSVRSIRLALTPAVKFLKYCSHFKENKITDNALSGYLWVYRGQRNAIYGFISFLNNHHHFSLVGHKQLIPISSTRYSKAQLKHKLVALLQKSVISKKQSNNFFRVALGYLHSIDLPDNAYIDYLNIKKDKCGHFYLHLVGNKFYLPTEIVTPLRDSI